MRGRRRATRYSAGTLSSREHRAHEKTARSPTESSRCLKPHSGHCERDAHQHSPAQPRPATRRSTGRAPLAARPSSIAAAAASMPAAQTPAVPATRARPRRSAARCRGAGPARRRARRAPCRRCVAASPPRRSLGRRAREAEVGGSSVNAATPSPSTVSTVDGVDGGELVEPVVAVEHHRPLGAERRERAEHPRRPSSASLTPTAWRLHPRRVRERTEEVERGRHAELLARRAERTASPGGSAARSRSRCRPRRRSGPRRRGRGRSRRRAPRARRPNRTATTRRGCRASRRARRRPPR